MKHRIAVIGAGHVGATTAYALMLRGLFPEIVLIDSSAAQAAAEAEAEIFPMLVRWPGRHGYSPAAILTQPRRALPS